MIKLSDTNLSASLKKDGLKPMYYVTGNDEFLVDACISRIVKAALGSDRDELIRLDAVKSTDDDLEQPFYTYSFTYKQITNIIIMSKQYSHIVFSSIRIFYFIYTF